MKYIKIINYRKKKYKYWLYTLDELLISWYK